MSKQLVVDLKPWEKVLDKMYNNFEEAKEDILQDSKDKKVGRKEAAYYTQYYNGAQAATFEAWGRLKEVLQ